MTQFEYEVYTDETETETTIRTAEIASVQDAVDAIEGDPDAVPVFLSAMSENSGAYDSYAEGHMGGLPENTDELDTVIWSVHRYYRGYIDSFEDYGHMYADSVFGIPEGLEAYINYDALGRDALENYLEYDGHYFEDH